MEKITNYKKTISKLLVLFIFMSFGFVSCKNNEGISSFAEELEILAEYILNNNITVSPTASGLYYIEITEGTGAQAKTGDYVTVAYSGTILNGASIGSGTYSFTIGNGAVIAGWEEGIALMKKGGEAQLIIPSNLAYGASGRDSIPPYSTLIFDVTLVDIR